MKKILSKKLKFKKNGYIKIKNFVNGKNIKRILLEIEKAKKVKKYFDRKKRIRRIEMIYNKGKFLKELNKNLLIHLEKIFKKKYLIFKDKFNAKPPLGEGFFAHFDGVFKFKNSKGKLKNGWYEYGGEFINILVALDDCNKKNGTIQISKSINKSFNSLYLLTNKDGTPNLKKDIEEKIKFKSIEMKKGDLLIFKNTCPHRSFKNSSNKSRRTLYYTYSLAKNGDKYQKYFLDKNQSGNRTSKSLTGQI